MTHHQTIGPAREMRRPDHGAEARVIHQALAAIHEAATGAAADHAGARLVRADGLCLSIAARLPRSAIVLNHGFVDATEKSLMRAAEIYRRAGVQRYFLSTDRAPDAAVLARAGLRPARGWRLFRRAAAAPLPHVARPCPVRRVRPHETGAVAKIVTEAFDLGPAAAPWIAALAKVAGWHVFVAELAGEVAATGALYVSGGYAWTDFGATRPESRGHGAQKALLAHRVRVARALGCHTLLTCTGEAVPGEAQISYRNILGAGFHEAELLHNVEPV